MEDRSFDALTRSLALGSNRRQILKRLLGLGGAALAGTAIHDAEAALRPTPLWKRLLLPSRDRQMRTGLLS
jgi:hypothetical protein